ncbi:MAG: hypothetical protein CSB47_00150 [Proteobacteria bacterium]|nr:MAG: hypothetical protein CSB47_00150 [Pseudomonadota bacterium]
MFNKGALIIFFVSASLSLSCSAGTLPPNLANAFNACNPKNFNTLIKEDIKSTNKYWEKAVEHPIFYDDCLQTPPIKTFVFKRAYDFMSKDTARPESSYTDDEYRREGTRTEQYNEVSAYHKALRYSFPAFSKLGVRSLYKRSLFTTKYVTS